MDKSIENFWPVPHTTAYEEPARLAEGGYLTVSQEEDGRRRKVYSLTDEGREALRAWAAEPTAAPPQLRDEADAQGLRRRRRRAARSERGATGTAEKLEELQGYLDEVRESEGWEPSERTLLAGVAYHRHMLNLLEELG